MSDQSIDMTPILDTLQSLVDIKDARESQPVPEGVGNKPSGDDMRDAVNRIVGYLRGQRDVESGIPVDPPEDDGGVSDAVTELQEDMTRLSPEKFTGADGVWVKSGPGGVTVGLDRQEDKPILIPFEPPTYILFSGGCRIDEANAAQTYSSNATMYNGWTGGSDEERVLLKLRKPIGLTYHRKFLSLYVDVITEAYFKIGTAGIHTADTSNMYFKVITQDFAYTGASCATWATRPSAGLQVHEETYHARGQYFQTADAGAQAGQFHHLVAVGAIKSAVVNKLDPPNTGDIYGIEVSIAGKASVGIYSTWNVSSRFSIAHSVVLTY